MAFVVVAQFLQDNPKSSKTRNEQPKSTQLILLQFSFIRMILGQR